MAKPEQTLEQQLDTSTTAAVKASRPHLMRGWECALKAGHKGGFHAFVSLVFADLVDEAEQIAQGIPQSERARTMHSPWAR